MGQTEIWSWMDLPGLYGEGIMNQVLKDVVYTLGTQKQVDFVAEVGGMNYEEKMFFQLQHERKSDSYIQDEMCLNRRSFDRIQESVRAKLKLAVFYCINKTMDIENA